MIYSDNHMAKHMTTEHVRWCLMTRKVTLGQLWVALNARNNSLDLLSRWQGTEMWSAVTLWQLQEWFIEEESETAIPGRSSWTNWLWVNMRLELINMLCILLDFMSCGSLIPCWYILRLFPPHWVHRVKICLFLSKLYQHPAPVGHAVFADFLCKHLWPISEVSFKL